ncbi:MAG: glycosyltransferase family 4 protein [Opitutaceae bacterium]|nr:glycosyltransferase family 4 protein [Opitutaceae bacterium]
MSTPALQGEIETPRPLRADGGRITITGWCCQIGAGSAPPVRLACADAILQLTARQARPDAAGLLPGEPAAANSGFTITGVVPPGVHLARLEAQASDGRWLTFRQFTIVASAEPFRAVVDTPIAAGTLRDRVKVGGWALDTAQPVTDLHLRYGHREIACRVDQERGDVPAAFPGVPHAARSGFVSDDFLVAGHGPVRVKARLADGRTVVAPTRVCFSIDRDENHAPDLDLTAARVGLPGEAPRPTSAASPTPASTPRNLLFILPGSFAANNALHVTALANELAAAGHACAVAVAHDLATLAHHAQPAFRGLLHQEATAGVEFPDGRGPNVIHAWTTRENVRRVTEQIRHRQGGRVVVHLEDNEHEILALTLGRPAGELAHLPEAELDRLVPGDLSHPRRSQEFLAKADGVTVITDRLREFVPQGRPCLTLWPAADARHFFPRRRPDAFREVLDETSGATVLFYHGNVHAANAREVRELYLAVLELNRSGCPTTLIRTGLDAVDFLGEQRDAVLPFVLNLGQILHHRHLAPLMALADIFVQPGTSDAFNDYRFPSKLPEFFSVGRPVILPRANLGCLVRHGTDAYVLERADAAGIARAVAELRRDPALADRLARGALAFADRHFSWRRSAAALASFYETLAGS